jgi:hypothetical protein
LLGEIQKELKLLEKHTNIYHLKSNSGKWGKDNSCRRRVVLRKDKVSRGRQGKDERVNGMLEWTRPNRPTQETRKLPDVRKGRRLRWGKAMSQQARWPRTLLRRWPVNITVRDLVRIRAIP